MFDDQDTQQTDDTIGQHSFKLSKDSKTKVPYWFLTKIESNLREEIIWLKNELAKRDTLIEKLSLPEQQVKVEIPNSLVNKGVGKTRVTPTMLSQMEEIEKKKRWAKIIEEQEAKSKAEGNVIEVPN